MTQRTTFQKNLHIIGEAAALFILTPYFIYFLYKYNNKITTIDYGFILTIIITTILVDGYLLLSWVV